MRKLFVRVLDLMAAPFAALAGIFLRLIRMAGLDSLPMSRRALFAVGLLPVRRHYYEPFPRRTAGPKTRSLPSICWNIAEQWKLVDSFKWKNEILALPNETIAGRSYSPDNQNFRGGDADLLYNVIRHFRPARIVEVGSGHSTLVAAKALRQNAIDGYSAKHLCIEPYEMSWLESIGVEVNRTTVETLPIEFFSALRSNDLLFIDSSHVVRAGGDVNYLVLDVLPTLSPGVIVHFHDIFSPADYPRRWIEEKALLWSEQYLLEAFLSGNPDWEMVLSANYLRHQDRERLADKCPLMESNAEPGSFYIRRKLPADCII